MSLNSEQDMEIEYYDEDSTKHQTNDIEMEHESEPNNDDNKTKSKNITLIVNKTKADVDLLCDSLATAKMENNKPPKKNAQPCYDDDEEYEGYNTKIHDLPPFLWELHDHNDDDDDDDDNDNDDENDKDKDKDKDECNGYKDYVYDDDDDDEEEKKNDELFCKYCNYCD